MTTELLTSLEFPAWTEAMGRTSVADLYRPRQRCGIYALRFETGELYVGQAVDVVRRFTQHRKTHGDITGITFQRVNQPDLSEVERRCIHTLEAAGVPLRNLSLMSVVQGERDLDLVVSPQEQEAWLAGAEDLQDSEQSVQDEALRQRHRRKFGQLLALPHADDALYFLGLYLNVVIPFPRPTELSFWMVSCLPYGVKGDENLYYRVSLNMQEVLSVYGTPQGLWASFHLARTPFKQELGTGWMDRLREEGWEVTDHAYEPGGQDQFQLVGEELTSLVSLVLDQTANTAMALLNLRLMRKGATYYGRSHCLDLVDTAIRRFAEEEEATRQSQQG